MPVLVFLAGAAERNAVQDRDVVFNDSGFADHKAGSVIEENAAADFRRRIDVGLEYG